MRLFLTNGMFGEHIEQIGNETEDVKKILEHIFAWKHTLDNQRKYKIESYDGFIFNDKNNTVAIDFGDYSTFMVIEDINEYQKPLFIGE